MAKEMYHCLDCGQLLTGYEYMEHSAAHTIERVIVEKVLLTGTYPGLWSRAGKFLKEKHPELRGKDPSKEMLIDLLLKELGF